MLAIVGSRAKHQFVVVIFKRHGFGHLLVRQRPVAEAIIEIVLTDLQQDSQRFVFGVSEQRG